MTRKIRAKNKKEEDRDVLVLDTSDQEELDNSITGNTQPANISMQPIQSTSRQADERDRRGKQAMVTTTEQSVAETNQNLPQSVQSMDLNANIIQGTTNNNINVPITDRRAVSVLGIRRLFNNTMNDEFLMLPRQSVLLQLKMADSYWERFMNEHMSLYDGVHTEQELNDATLVMQETEILYSNLVTKLQVRLSDYKTEMEMGNRAQRSPTNSASSNGLASEVRLKRINIEPFNGLSDKWPAFRDMFITFFHSREDLTKTAKFLHLISHLVANSEPYNVIASLPRTSEYYDGAWELLCNFYDDERKMVEDLVVSFLDMPAIVTPSRASLINLINRTNSLLQSLPKFKVEVDKWDPILVPILLRKLDSESRKDWSKERPQKVVAKLAPLLEFLNTRADGIDYVNAIQAVGQNSNASARKQQLSTPNVSPSVASSVAQASTATASTSQDANGKKQPLKCYVCKQEHLIYKCPTFLTLSVDNRIKRADDLNLCRNCLRKGHKDDKCKMAPCKTCKVKHNGWLCKQLHQPTVNTAFSQFETSIDTAPFYNHTLLATMRLLAKDRHGNLITVRALCDTGAQMNVATTDCVQRLKLGMKRTGVSISGVGGEELMSVNGVVTLELYSIHDITYKIQLRAIVLKKITGRLPTMKVDSSQWDYINGLPLADPIFGTPGEIDVLLAANVYSQIVCDGLKQGPIGAPTAQATKCGWIVFGNIPLPLPSERVLHIRKNCKLSDINESLARLWELESVNTTVQRTAEEQFCEDNFTQNTTRTEDGNYIVRIPINPDANELGNSREIALKRLLQQERRFKKSPDLQEKYIKFMREYEALGHMVEVGEVNLHQGKINYVPHHAAGTSKFRTVFDASCKTSNGTSLNDIQMTGEKLQNELTTITMKFRLYKIALTADIVKMYRQVLVPADQQNLQRILWRESPDQPIKEYCLLTQTYGLRSAAHNCVRALKQCAIDNKDKYPIASDAVESSFYVDDFIASVSSEEEAKQLINELNSLLSKGGFTLAKWQTNDWSVHSHIVENENIDTTINGKNMQAESSVLGLKWSPRNDCLYFTVSKLPHDKKITKRAIVAHVAKLYDPNGYIAPVIVSAKILIQELWSSGCEWDAKVTNEFAKRWLEFSNTLQAVEKIQIPRWIGITKELTVQIHGFCDASNKAYGVAFYARVQSKDGLTITRLVASKTRVAPLKQSTIPRLELCGAHLLAKMLNEITIAHGVQNKDCHLWSDSMIVLHWLNKNPSTMKTYVANRIAEAQEITAGAEWHHVPTDSNPADYASRGVKPEEIVNNRLWFDGPSWLSKEPSKWPQRTINEPLSNVELESNEKEAKPPVINVVNEEKALLSNKRGSILLQYSDLSKLLRVTSYVLRFVNNTKKYTLKRVGIVTYDEVEAAEKLWIKSRQEAKFTKEIEACKNNLEIPKNSSLIGTKPFIDDKGILRVGGRLKNAELPFDKKHPIVLPANDHLSLLYVRNAHKKMLHGGTQATMQYLREKFWIIKMRQMVKSIIYKCVPCFRQRKEVSQQLMGQCPKQRVTPSRPFSAIGVDYCGPFTIKAMVERARKTTKGYCAVFVCMATRAVHLELVKDLTTASFMAALNRLISRRGTVYELFSDNGTTFHGADREITATWETISTTSEFAATGIKWQFITPLAPNQGGIWEAAVKSAKHHLKRVVGVQQLTYDELYTLLVQVEGCLNSRPIAAITDDVTDAVALTPAHLIIGGPIVAAQESDLTGTPENRLSRWKLVQRAQQNFWKSWHQEYLQQLLQRTKWRFAQPNVQVDDIVIVMKDGIPPTQWPLGKIVATHPGSDGYVRNVDVIYNGSIYSRAINRICMLPKNDEPDLDQDRIVNATSNDGTTGRKLTLSAGPACSETAT